MKMNKIIAGTSAAALSITMAGVAMAATDNDTINLQVNVQDTLTFECYDIAGGSGDMDVDLGTVTAGTPVTAGSRCVATTNDDSGYYLTMDGSDTNGTGQVLEHEDPNQAGTFYSIADSSTAWADTTIGGTTGTALWVDGTTTGLGFTLGAFPDANLANNTFAGTEFGTMAGCGDVSANRFAGVSDTANTIAAVSNYVATATTTDVCYKVDVPATQQSGVYTGSITYTATTDASAYVN